MKRIRVGDIETAYRFDGLVDDPQAPVVMMAHALGTDHQIWNWQLPELTARFRVLRYDWRGHGQTDAPTGDYSLMQLVDDATGLLDALQIEQVHWVGLSTGGMIGQGMGIYRNDRVASLSLCNTMAKAGDNYRESVAQRRTMLQTEPMGAVWELTKHQWFTDAFVAGADARYHTIRDSFVRIQIPGYLGAMAAVSELAYEDKLGSIDCPVLIMSAGDDPVTTPAAARRMQTQISGSTLVMLDGQRHFSNVEVPDRFNPPLVQFLTSVS